jgi:hypothetical protein
MFSGLLGKSGSSMPARYRSRKIATPTTRQGAVSIYPSAASR